MREVFLNESARVPHARFVPATHAQYLTSVFTLWNLLDGVMYRHRHRPPFYPYGYMRRVQLERYSALAAGERVRRYCETGVNGGHGTAAVLLANPSLVAHSFDEVRQPYSEEVVAILKAYFRERFVLYRGDSHKTLPAAVPALRGTCDLLLVDGDHSERGAYQDIADMQSFASCNATLLLDDVGSDRLNAGPGRALARARDKGIVSIVEWNKYADNAAENPCLRDKHGGRPLCLGAWGWAIAQYRSSRGCDRRR
jgi:hypothetical protein